MLSPILLVQFHHLADDAVLAAGVLLIISSLMISLRKRRRNRAQQPSSRDYARQLRETETVRSLRGDLETLMVEIEQMARRLGAQLDNKAVRLERLLEEARHTLEALETAGRQPPPSKIAATAVAKEAPTRNDQPPQAELSRDPLTQSVYQMADEGLSAARIAESLEEHIGKIELILALRRP